MRNLPKSKKVDNVEFVDKNERKEKSKKNLDKKSTPLAHKNVDRSVDNVDNYSPRSFSPTVTISPAPIVINRSPVEQFSNKKFSISSKEGK